MSLRGSSRSFGADPSFHGLHVSQVRLDLDEATVRSPDDDGVPGAQVAIEWQRHLAAEPKGRSRRFARSARGRPAALGHEQAIRPGTASQSPQAERRGGSPELLDRRRGDDVALDPAELRGDIPAARAAASRLSPDAKRASRNSARASGQSTRTDRRVVAGSRSCRHRSMVARAHARGLTASLRPRPRLAAPSVVRHRWATVRCSHGTVCLRAAGSCAPCAPGTHHQVAGRSMRAITARFSRSAVEGDDWYRRAAPLRRAERAHGGEPAERSSPERHAADAPGGAAPWPRRSIAISADDAPSPGGPARDRAGCRRGDRRARAPRERRLAGHPRDRRDPRDRPVGRDHRRRGEARAGTSERRD